MLKRAIGDVIAILAERNGAVELEVALDGSEHGCPGLSRAIAYPSLCGPVNVGDRVLLNTTAVDLNLGTGGYHFVIANLSNEPTRLFAPDIHVRGEQAAPDMDVRGHRVLGHRECGHIMKLRYTPTQHAVMSVEEEDSPYRAAVDAFTSLDGLPVIVGQLHSQIAPACAAIKRIAHIPIKIAYCMTDTAALPISFSRLVGELKTTGLIDTTITCGQAFGGDFETVNIYTALIAAKVAANADAVIACQGPGNVGTGTTYGYSAIEQGEIINAVNILGGRAIAIPRVSFADPRARHRGISHHTITSLTKIALTPAVVALPMIEEMKLNLLEEQLARAGATLRHKVRVLDGSIAIDELRAKGIKLQSMGRGYEEDPEFFLAAAAAGAAAAQMVVAAKP